ncbi:MAG: GNAT family N-acetyltransferase [Pseudomonadota bacterium]
MEKSHSAWKYGYLVWLGVRPGLQRHGVAARLFRALRELLIEQGARILLVDTEADNLPALHFFRKQGFGSPQEHIFLSQNLDQRRRKNGERKASAKVHEPAPAAHGNGHDDPTPEVD